MGRGKIEKLGLKTIADAVTGKKREYRKNTEQRLVPRARGRMGGN
jgi:hypothetical protein